MSDIADLVPQFLAVTGCEDADRATNYLEMSGGSLETAVGLYLEHQGGGGGAPGGTSVGTGTSGGGGAAAGMMGGDIRAPDATQTMRLMDDGVMMGSHMSPYFNPISAMLEESIQRSAFAASPPSRSRSARDTVNAAAASASVPVRRSRVEDLTDEKNDDMDEGGDDDYDYDEEDDDDDDEDATGAARAAGSDPDSNGPSQSGLADMFAPPDHLIFKDGGFEGARSVAKDSKRWLLVNIQRDSEFSCHALNRDVWRDELVENLVREGFIFWQTMDVTREGQTYVQRYKVYDFPHLAIIDPRTRRLMWRKEGWTQQNPMTAESFAELAMDFCSRHSFNKPPTAPRPNGAAPSSRPAKRPMHEMSEEEQLQAAMQASLQDDEGDDEAMDTGNEEENADDSVEYLGTAGSNDDSKPEAVPDPPKEPTLIEQLIATEVGEEPAKGSRIQFRMPDGKRIIRRFSPSDQVRLVYAFVAQSNDEAKTGKEFVLKAGFPPKDLFDSIDATVESCKLAGDTVTMMWK